MTRQKYSWLHMYTSQKVQVDTDVKENNKYVLYNNKTPAAFDFTQDPGLVFTTHQN